MKSCIIWCKKKNSDFFWKKDFTVALKEKTIGVFLDMEKAFDRVWHAGLKLKLRLLGLPDIILRWISSFLSDRKLRVNINGKNSRYIQPNFGVPQGSPLSPLLFILFVTDISINIKDSIISQFADDIALYVSNKRITESQENIQRNLNKLDKWCNTSSFIKDRTSGTTQEQAEQPRNNPRTSGTTQEQPKNKRNNP